MEWNPQFFSFSFCEMSFSAARVNNEFSLNTFPLSTRQAQSIMAFLWQAFMARRSETMEIINQILKNNHRGHYNPWNFIADFAIIRRD